MTVIAQWSGQGVAAGTTLTTSTAGTGDTAFTAISGAAPVTATGGIGPSGIRLNWNPTGVASYVDWGSGVVGSLSAMAVRLYMQFSAWPSSSFTILRALNASAAQQWGVDLGGTGSPGQVRLRNAANNANTAASATNAITTGTTYRFEVTWDTSGAATCNVYSGNGATALATLSGNTGGTSPVTLMRWGPISGVQVAQYYSSNYALANTASLIGPIVASSGPTLVGVWDGTSIRTAALRGVWDGTTLRSANLNSVR